MWVKFRHKFSSGAEEWEWEYLWKGLDKPSEEYADEWAREKADQYEYSEHYRGIDYDFLPVPPKEVIRKHLSQEKDLVARHQACVDDLETLLKIAK